MNIRIHTLLIGQPRTSTDERGTWRSAIFRTPVAGPVLLHQRGLAGDQVADTANHGTPDQAVCCHPLVHYSYWNAVYELSDSAQLLGPGSVGENWTLSDVSEADICVGDVFRVGEALVQVSAPRYPCSKQERKLRLPGFLQRTLETMRTGFYLRVLQPGLVQAGAVLQLLERPQPELSIQRINEHCHQTLDPILAEQLLALPELAQGWKRIVRLRMSSRAGA